MLSYIRQFSTITTKAGIAPENYFELFFGLRSINRANTCTSAAIETFVSVDNVLAVLFGNSFYGTFGSAGTAADAVVGNFVCHNKNLHV